MFSHNQTQISQNTAHYTINWQEKAVTFQDWIELCQSSPDFVHVFSQLLTASDYEAFFWEVKPITQEKIYAQFEFVLVESRMLSDISANPKSFLAKFESGGLVTSFPNLGGDAQLVIPFPITDQSIYGHLASFLRRAPKDQIFAFWQKAAQAYELQIGQNPKWLSTAGLGVPRLHLRIDSRPKYYRHKPYKG